MPQVRDPPDHNHRKMCSPLFYRTNGTVSFGHRIAWKRSWSPGFGSNLARKSASALGIKHYFPLHSCNWALWGGWSALGSVIFSLRRDGQGLVSRIAVFWDPLEWPAARAIGSRRGRQRISTWARCCSFGVCGGKAVRLVQIDGLKFWRAPVKCCLL